MGMFDYVNFSMPCPQCGAELNGFQSKDGDCDLDKIEPDLVRNFYCACTKCKSWIEFYRPRPDVPLRKKPLTLEQVTEMGFSMSVRPPKDV